MEKLTESNTNRVKFENKAEDATRVPLINSSELFGESKEIMIRHHRDIYRLRITRNGKLVMNK